VAALAACDRRCRSAEREELDTLSKRDEGWHGGHEIVLPWRILLAGGN